MVIKVIKTFNIMEILLQRIKQYPDVTLGKLYINGQFYCHTLEPAIRKEKDKYLGAAIPAGTYSLELTKSRRFNRLLPLLLNVPGFEGIRIHAGNKKSDTRGCILLGREQSGKIIYRSAEAVHNFIRLLFANPSEKHEITIKNSEPP